MCLFHDKVSLLQIDYKKNQEFVFIVPSRCQNFLLNACTYLFFFLLSMISFSVQITNPIHNFRTFFHLHVVRLIQRLLGVFRLSDFHSSVAADIKLFHVVIAVFHYPTDPHRKWAL